MRLSKTWLKLLSVLGIFLVGCASQPAPQSAPTPEWLYVQVPDSLLSLSDDFQACTPSGSGLALLSPLEPGTPQIILRWGEIQSDNSHAYEIGEEQLVFVVHPDNPVTRVRFENIQKAYTSKLYSLNWQILGGSNLPLTLTGYAPESEVAPLLLQLLGGSEADFPRELVLVPSPQEMRTFIANTPGGLGILPRRWVNDTVRVLPLEGLSQSQTFPILALSTTEPQGQTREWLLCMQSRLSD